MSNKNTSPLDKAFAALLAEDDARALEALALIQEQGDARAIFPLLHALAATEDHARQRRIKALLFGVKAKDAAAELARALDTAELLDVRKTVLAAFWNAGLDARPFTERLVQIAVEGDAEEVFEVMTVLENQDDLPVEAARQGLARITKVLGREKDAYRKALLGNLKEVLESRA